MIYKTLQLQYQFVTGTRQALIKYCKTLAPADLQKQVPEFNNNTIVDMLVHNANVYLHWLIIVGEQKEQPYFESNENTSLADVEKAFSAADGYVADFLKKREHELGNIMLFNVPGKASAVSLSPLQIFTHVITHEFHHKGQILSMSRLLGYTPPDTDVIRF